MLLAGRSRRTEKDRELVSFESDWFRVEGKLEREERGEVDLSVRFTPESSREMLVYGSKVPRMSSYMAESGCVFFDSTDVELILGEPTFRRQFLNEGVTAVSPGYLTDLARYRRVLEQKNRLLKDIRAGMAPVTALDMWNPQVAQYGSRLCHRRKTWLEGLSGIAGELYSLLSESREDLALQYAPSVTAPDNEEGWQESFLEALEKVKRDEAQRGVALVGPQRDDITVLISGRPARSFASRGQARTAALALRLAQARLARQRTGEWPVLLMDDIFAELDPLRRRLVAEAAAEAQQVFAAAASQADLPELPSGLAGRLDVSGGTIALTRF